MPLYELVCIARSSAPIRAAARAATSAAAALNSTLPFAANFAPTEGSTVGSYQGLFAAPEKKPLTSTQKLIKESALQILDRKGVVKGFELTDADKTLPYRMKRHQEIFDSGDYFVMQFYSSPQSMRALSRSLRYDQRVIRHTMIKVGESLAELSAYQPPEKL
ncbi:hypothetical protein SpCBS45565_g03599 [Spizellomyces sp. 'palustris']|nr:hypothetical protein SpCBS45565_g03599 [Spizellomyces sp. 'palustris']